MPQNWREGEGTAGLNWPNWQQGGGRGIGKTGKMCQWGGGADPLLARYSVSPPATPPNAELVTHHCAGQTYGEFLGKYKYKSKFGL